MGLGTWLFGYLGRSPTDKTPEAEDTEDGGPNAAPVPCHDLPCSAPDLNNNNSNNNENSDVGSGKGKRKSAKVCVCELEDDKTQQPEDSVQLSLTPEGSVSEDEDRHVIASATTASTPAPAPAARSPGTQKKGQPSKPSAETAILPLHVSRSGTATSPRVPAAPPTSPAGGGSAETARLPLNIQAAMAVSPPAPPKSPVNVPVATEDASTRIETKPGTFPIAQTRPKLRRRRKLFKSRPEDKSVEVSVESTEDKPEGDSRRSDEEKRPARIVPMPMAVTSGPRETRVSRQNKWRRRRQSVGRTLERELEAWSLQHGIKHNSALPPAEAKRLLGARVLPGYLMDPTTGELRRALMARIDTPESLVFLNCDLAMKLNNPFQGVLHMVLRHSDMFAAMVPGFSLAYLPARQAALAAQIRGLRNPREAFSLQRQFESAFTADPSQAPNLLNTQLLVVEWLRGLFTVPNYLGMGVDSTGRVQHYWRIAGGRAMVLGLSEELYHAVPGMRRSFREVITIYFSDLPFVQKLVKRSPK